jgi:hypothetical protein
VTRTWFVVFAPEGGRRFWWDRWFTRPGYRHVGALTAELGGTLVLDPCLNRMHLAWHPRPVPDVLADALAAGAWVLRAEVTPAAEPRRQPALFTCVEAVKAAMGLDWPLCLTPRQLAVRLRRAGAVPVVSIAEGD